MNPQSWIHLRELARVTGSTPGTLKKEVDALLAAGLIQMRQVGNQTQFCVNAQHPVYPELRALIEKTVGVGDVLRQMLQPLSAEIQGAFVFGSVAQASEHAHSDIDVLVIGSVGFAQVVQALYPAQSTIGREINPKVMALQEWQSRQAQADSFVQDVMSKPKLFLLGSEDDLRSAG